MDDVAITVNDSPLRGKLVRHPWLRDRRAVVTLLQGGGCPAQAASSSAEPEPEPEPDAGGLAAGVEEQNPLGPLATLTALHRAESGQSIGRSLGYRR